MEYGVYGNLIIIYPKPSSIYLRGTIRVFFRGLGIGPGDGFWGLGIRVFWVSGVGFRELGV